MELKKYKLGELLSKIENGAVIKQNKGAKGIPITRIETLSNGLFNRDKLGYADIEDPTLYSDYILEDNDLLMSHINSKEFVGRTVIYKKQANECIIHGMNLLRIKTNTKLLDPEFAYYYFQTDTIKKSLYNLRKDAIGQSSIAISDIKNMVVAIPSISIQKEIAFVLRCYDRKLDVNSVINQNLEAMAKQLYDYWFVQFDFPNEDGKPYKSSGSAMVWNEELKREIPQGWSNMSIGDYAPCKSGYAFKSKDFGGKGLPVIKIGNIQENYTLDMTDSQCIDLFNKTLFLAKRYDLVIAMTGATIGKFAISQSNYWVNQRVGRFDLGDRPLSRLGFLFNSLKQEYFREQVFQIACGCAQPNISAEQIDSISILKPNDVILNQFNKLCEPLLELQSENYLQIEELTKQRDELLPLLMNGQVSVNSDLSAH